MVYYKDAQGGLHALDDAKFSYLLPAGVSEISEQDHLELSKPSARDLVMQQIHALESTVTQRRLREAALGEDDGWLAGVDEKISDLRKKLASAS